MKLAYLMPLSVETIANAKRLGYDALEVGARWVDSPYLTEIEQNLRRLQDALSEAGIGITSVAIYGGTIETEEDRAVEHYERATKLARAFKCSVVSGMTGRDNSLTIDESMPIFKKYFGRIARIAEDNGVRIALEPWPGGIQGHGPYRWTNMATTPELWDRLFEAVPNSALGLEYDPSHLVWQGIDHLQAFRDYAARIHHIHAKDILIDEQKLKRVGIHGRNWWRFVIPGLGQIDWPQLFATMKAAKYSGNMAVEHEDREYLNQRWNEGLALALKTLRPLVDAY